MPTCPECKHRFRTLEDEENDHPCPRCGFHPRLMGGVTDISGRVELIEEEDEDE